ncbi:unnamed protein product [Polarella glacialis]|uniref:Uncharacterized protein n=1 Tax=Polarella glacialis TaxID=89957 RepID=A0A813DB97_POLGL|nr:unnamed protein product [Polarella glacialis]
MSPVLSLRTTTSRKFETFWSNTRTSSLKMHAGFMRLTIRRDRDQKQHAADSQRSVVLPDVACFVTARDHVKKVREILEQCPDILLEDASRLFFRQLCSIDDRMPMHRNTRRPRAGEAGKADGWCCCCCCRCRCCRCCCCGCCC